MPQKKGKIDQVDRFIETARAIGAEEDKAAFKAKLAQIAKQKPKDDPILPQRPKSND